MFYGWLLMIMVKGRKINWKYTACVGIIMIEGITYEVQMDWVIVFEMIMMISIKHKIDIFEIGNVRSKGLNVLKIVRQVIECI